MCKIMLSFTDLMQGHSCGSEDMLINLGFFLFISSLDFALIFLIILE